MLKMKTRNTMQPPAADILAIYNPDGIKTDEKSISGPNTLEIWEKEVRRRARAWEGPPGFFMIAQYQGEQLQGLLMIQTGSDIELINVQDKII